MSVMLVTLGVDLLADPREDRETMARKLIYRIYPVVIASAVGYLIGLFVMKGL